MDWTPFLTAALRVADLHDSGHTPGSFANPPDEKRSGRGDGLWLDIGCRLLDFVHEADQELNDNWVPLGVFFEETLARHPAVGVEDLRWVVIHLSTPCVVYAIPADSECPPHRVRSTKATALLERPPFKGPDRCRLTPLGRQAVHLARAGDQWLYAHHDAEKIITAIKAGDFGEIPRHAADVTHSLRTLSQEIVRLLELPGHDELFAAFEERQNHYLESLQKVQSAVSEARHLLALGSVENAFEVWRDSRPSADLSLVQIFTLLHQLLQTAEGLGRNFSGFIRAITSRQRTPVGLLRFDLAFYHFVMNPPAPAVLSAAFKASAPWSCGVSAVGPDDARGVLPAASEGDTAEPMTFDEAKAPPLPSEMEAFLAARSAEICAALAQGPVSLSTAFGAGWAEVGGRLHVGELMGVFSAPDWLGKDIDTVRIGYRPGGLSVDLGDGRRLAGDDLVLTLERSTP